MTVPLSRRWLDVFMDAVQRHEASATLREAALDGKLGPWTKALTSVVVGTFKAMSWAGAAKGYPAELLPVTRQEYLALDAVAFNVEETGRWAFPVATFELENSRSDDLVAYALWKVLCVRTDLRVVFCYRRDAEAGASLVRSLTEQVVRSMGIQERMRVQGETMVIVGSYARSETFPYGFFKDWILETNTGRFVRG